MLKTRLWMGTVLIGVALLILFEGNWFAPYFPVFFCASVVSLWFGTKELLELIDPSMRPNSVLSQFGILALLLANWAIPIQRLLSISIPISPWIVIAIVFLLLVLITFLREMYFFTGPNQITARISVTMMIFVYLGLFPSFLFQLRFLNNPSQENHLTSLLALSLAIFVPKVGDIGAYFTGKFLTGKILGRHLMTPLLSPKKTWQGAFGGILASTLTAIALAQIVPIIPGGLLGAIAFGITVSIAGIFGDLAESLLKRDCQIKDASKSIPGFGGFLDVLDSLIFASPVVYLWVG
jgi:phosphatidate cytidylyltransferase